MPNYFLLFILLCCMRCKYKLFRPLKGEKLAPVFTNKNRSHPVHDVAQATPRPEWNSPNCWVARPRDAPLPSYFGRGSWLSHSSRQPDRDCERPPTPWHLALSKSAPALVPGPEKEMQFPEIPAGVAAPQPSRTCRRRTRAAPASPEAPGARASPGRAGAPHLAARRAGAAVLLGLGSVLILPLPAQGVGFDGAPGKAGELLPR